MSFRTLAILPLVLAAAFAALTSAHALSPEAASTVGSLSGKVLALAGSAAAAFAFERGDYLRRAWLLSAVCFLLLAASDVAHAAGLESGSLAWVQGVTVVAANLASVVGTWMLAHAFRASGLEHDDAGRGGRLAVLAAAIVLSVAVTGLPLWNDALALAQGDASALTSVASDLGDAVCLALIAPVLQTAIALRGGLLVWPWAFLTASGAAWIFYDATSSVVTATHAVGSFAGSEALRMLGSAYFFSAGLAQRSITER